MTKNELNITLSNFYNNSDNFGACVYAIMKNNDSSIFKIDIEAQAIDNLKNLFLNSLQNTINDDIELLNLSSADDRNKAIYLYDIDERPLEFNLMNNISKGNADIEFFNLKDHNLNNIKAILIEIGNNEQQLIIYKILTPVNIYGKQSFFLKKCKTRMKQIDEEFLRLSPNFQLLKINDDLIAFDLNILEKNFGFKNIIIKEARKGIDKINQMDIIENIDVLFELLDEIKYARKLTKICDNSPVINAGISNEAIVNFCKTYNAIAGKIRFNENKNKILLDTKFSKEVFIKILMDDFLTSELTKLNYESKAKDNI